MSERSTWRRLAGGVGVLVAIAALALMASSSAFAYNSSTDQASTTANGGPLNAAGVVSVLTLNVASVETAIASYSFPSSNTNGVAGLSNPTTIRTMYQQWRHTGQNDWFYVYATNGNTSVTTPVWDYYYYTPARGASRINSVASAANSALVGSGSLQTAVSYVYLTTGTGVPAFAIDTVMAGTGGPCQSAIGSACLGANFSVGLRWGLAEQGFRTGSMILQQGVESFPIATATTPALTVYYSAFQPVTQADATSTVALTTVAPAQSATGVSNASGARNANTATAYQSIQTVTDADGDVNNGSLIWVFSSGTQAGQWYQAGVQLQRTTGGYSDATAAGSPVYSVFYQSWNEAVVYTTGGAQLTTNYFTTLNVTAAGTAGDRGAGENGFNSLAITYNYVYANAARGTATLYGRAEDWHGRTSGNVQVGTQTIS